MNTFFIAEQLFACKHERSALRGKHNCLCQLCGTFPVGFGRAINAIDWNLKHANADQFDYYKELIALRKAHPAFRMTKAEDFKFCPVIWLISFSVISS